MDPAARLALALLCEACHKLDLLNGILAAGGASAEMQRAVEESARRSGDVVRRAAEALADDDGEGWRGSY